LIDAELYAELKKLRERICEQMDDSTSNSGVILQLERIDAIDVLMEMLN